MNSSANEVASLCQSSSLQGILFDLDGTLLDTYDLLQQSFRRATREVLGYVAPMEHFNRTIGRPLDEQMLGYGDEETARALSAAYRSYDHQMRANALKTFDGMEEALEELKCDGWRLGVVTSKRHESAQFCLDLFDMMRFFECLIGADDVVRPKPDPNPIEVGSHLLGLESTQCLYVGDSPYDMQAAAASGARGIAVAWGQHPIETLCEQHPVACCATPADLPRLARSLRDKTFNKNGSTQSAVHMDSASTAVYNSTASSQAACQTNIRMSNEAGTENSNQAHVKDSTQCDVKAPIR